MVTNLFFDDTVVQKGVLLADSVRGDIDIPPYHVLFNAIGDADRSRPSLERAVAIAAASPAAVINDPAAVLRTGRVEMMQRLRGHRRRARAADRTHRARPADGGRADAARVRVSAAAALARLSRRRSFRAGRNAPLRWPASRRACPAASCSRSSTSTRAAPTGTCASIGSSASTAGSFRCTWRSRRSGRCTTSAPKWPTGRTIGPKKRPSSPTCRGRSASAACARSKRSTRRWDSIMPGSISDCPRRVRSWCSKRTRRWRSIAPK